MKILFASSEVAPFAKTGGLGDVGAALPKALGKKGHDVRVVMPCYRRVWEGGHAAKKLLGPISVEMGSRRYSFETLETKLPGSEVPVYLVHCPALYDRPEIYGQANDEHVRFGLLNWAALRIAQHLQFSPDIVHANDWQTSLLPMMVRRVFGWDRLFQGTRSVLTIHNIGHQGTFGASALHDIGLGMDAPGFHQEELAQGRVSFLLTGILYANAISTVSPTYAREIQTTPNGVGLEGFLRARREVLFGILNGIDDEAWSPKSDPLLPARYSADDLAGKEKNKQALCEVMKLPYRKHTPIIGIVSRLVWQKGFDLCFEALPALLKQRDAQLVVLGGGEPKYEQLFGGLSRWLPGRVSFKNGFSEPLAHLIEAGSDMFLMPSRYEPCGLNQLYSLVYGTPPIVHATGGLKDTVSQYDPRSGRGNGFSFEHFTVAGLKWALGAAVDTYKDEKAWSQLVQNGMREEHGWSHRVSEYEKLYDAVWP